MEGSAVMFDHPIIGKVMATVIATTFITTGAVTWSNQTAITAHREKIDSLAEIKEDVKATRSDVGDIKTDVAVLKERTRILEGTGDH